MCVSELRGLGAIHEKLSKAGGAVLGISVDKPEDSRRVVEKYALPFDLLSDTEVKVVREYGLYFHDGFQDKDMALPANFLIDEDGRIAWSWIAARVQDRADPAVVETQVEALGK